MDVFAFGQVIQCIVTGEPHSGTGREKLGTLIDGDKIDKIDNIIEKCLQNNPKKRYQNIQEILDDLSKLDINKKQELINNKIDEDKVFEYICSYDVPTTSQIAELFNYDLHSLKISLNRLYNALGIIKPAWIIDNPENDNCHWMKK
jgi:serine/threonine protein kinase